MLTDIFAYRYIDHPIWTDYTEVEQRLLNQVFAIAKEILPPFDYNGNSIKQSELQWKYHHDQLARELGIDELSKRYYSYTQKNHFGNEVPVQGFLDWHRVCEYFVKAPFPKDHKDPDLFIKERISLIELIVRFKNEEIQRINDRLPQVLTSAAAKDALPRTGIRTPGSAVDGAKALNRNQNDTFNTCILELNERFRRARTPLTYHNGFIQVSLDEIIEQNIAKPFWNLVANPLWKNVDLDMKEALDHRDSNGKDPAFYAAKALESTIKIISDIKSWTRGTESGASQYIDNFVSKTNGSFLTVWESDMLKNYFSKVRNPLGHGPGSAEMPVLSAPQTDWAIETAMSWIRNLIRRFEDHT